MDDGERVCIAIDLKSFYASVECVLRGLDPLKTHLVVADPTRTEKTICLAVTPSLKAYGISGRARLFEVVQRVEEINRERLDAAVRGGYILRGRDGKAHFHASSCDAEALEADPSLELAYYVAPPRMKLYEEFSTKIFSIYKEFISPEDIIVYSIDEIFADVTRYLKPHKMTARELVTTMIKKVYTGTGITATAGIGSNLFLAKVAMDIVAKRVPADGSGARIAELDEKSFREQLWCHEPITDFWRVGRGTARRLERLGCRTMGDVARLSERNEAVLYDAFGVNAELLIDHAWGWESTTVRAVKQYRPGSRSISSGQVLKEPYDREMGRLIVREMTELLALELARKRLVTDKLELTLGYDRTSLAPSARTEKSGGTGYIVTKTGRPYAGTVTSDPYGRPQPKHAHGTTGPGGCTNSTRRIVEAMLALFDRIADADLLIRRVNIAALDLIREEAAPAEEKSGQLSLFENEESAREEEAARQEAAKREKRLQETTLRLQEKYGPNAVLKGMNLLEGGTTIERNGQIGGHRSGERGFGTKHPAAERERRRKEP